MLIGALAVTTIGTVVGAVIGALCTRRRRGTWIHAAIGALGALLHAVWPTLRGLGYIDTDPTAAVVVGGASAALATLFLPVRFRR